MLSKNNVLLSALLCLCCALAVVAEQSKTTPANLTAAQIVERNVAARGGLQGWRAVQAMSWSGKMDAGGGSLERSRRLAEGGRERRNAMRVANKSDAAAKGEANKQAQLPFVLQMKRPGKSRVEIEFAGKTAVQVYDGANGWKVRPFLNRNDVQPFTAEEVKAESEKAELDGPLVDYAAKGTDVELEGVEAVEGRDAYKLKLTTKSGNVQHIWIDTQSFFDVKVEGTPRRMDGRMRTVWIYQRDFRPVQGLMIPFVLVTAVDGYRETHSMVIEKVAVNPKLDDALFTKPKV
jgi:outer membrane lipoprotein-sorting protein